MGWITVEPSSRRAVEPGVVVRGPWPDRRPALAAILPFNERTPWLRKARNGACIASLAE